MNYTFGSLKGLLQTAKAIFFSSYKDEHAAKILNEWPKASHGPLVQIAAPAAASSKTNELQSVSGD